MGSLNRVQLIGHLGRDAELRYTPSGTAVATVNLATSESWADKSGGGEKKEKTEWHRIVLWDKLADALAPYLTKGKQVYIEGKLTTRQYEKDGQKHYSTEIRGDKVVLLGSSGKAERPAHVRDEDVGHGEPTQHTEPVDLSDIPF